MGEWRKKIPGPNPKKKKRKRRSQYSLGANLADVAVSLLSRHNGYMVGTDAPNYKYEPIENKPMSFDDWLAYGFRQGWCGAPICYTHDGLPTTEAEDAEFEELDPCVHIVRLYVDEQEKRDVEANHSPSQWRASNMGLIH